VAEFLLLDRLFPRSAFFALGDAEHCLAELSAHSVGRVGYGDEARRILGRARNELEFTSVSELLSDLPSHLSALQVASAQAADAVARRFFRHTGPVEWQREEVTGT
jgi:uncharacterized alpha-E superfamily protein